MTSLELGREIRNVNSSVETLYYRVNSVLYDFKDIPCKVNSTALGSF